MRLVKIVRVSGAPVWVNPAQIVQIAPVTNRAGEHWVEVTRGTSIHTRTPLLELVRDINDAMEGAK